MNNNGQKAMDETLIREMLGMAGETQPCPRGQPFSLPHTDNPSKQSKLWLGCRSWPCPVCGMSLRFSNVRHFAKLAFAHLGPIYETTFEAARWEAIRKWLHRQNSEYARVRLSNGGSGALFTTASLYGRSHQHTGPGPAVEAFARCVKSCTLAGVEMEMPVIYSRGWSIGRHEDSLFTVVPPADWARPSRREPKAPKPSRQVTHDLLCEKAAAWLRSARRCAAVSTRQLMASERPDAIGWTPSGVSTVVECKTSKADFLHDFDKPHRKFPELGMGQFRYYLTPPGLLTVDDLPAGWGLLELRGSRVYQLKESKPFQGSFHLERMYLVDLVRGGRNFEEPAVRPLYSFGY